MNFIEFEDGEYIYLDLKKITYVGLDKTYQKEIISDKYSVNEKYCNKYTMIYDGHILNISKNVFYMIKEQIKKSQTEEKLKD